MKKILSILIMLCLLASALSVTAFAAGPTVLRVTAERRGEEPKVIGDYDNFQDGWNAAMEIAGDKDEMRANNYTRIVVDLYADWEANDDGEFTDEILNGAGFDNDTIYVPADAKVMINMNGHTIDRGLTAAEDDGEVIFINDDADVIINDGTIKGGYSNSEGGGLYIEGGAYATLNNVNIVGNSVKGDDGSAVYLYGDATLTMNGGSIRDNTLDEKHLGIDIIEPFGTICAMDSKVILNSVTIDGNYSLTNQARGVILYAKGSIVKMNQCTVSNNLAKGSAASHAIYVEDSSLTVTNTNFTNNNTLSVPGHSVALYLFRAEDSNLIITGGSITQNGGSDIFYLDDTEADITDVAITDNACNVMTLINSDKVVNMIGCTFGNNTPFEDYETFCVKHQDTLMLLDCTLGDSTFSDRQYVKITTSEVTREEAVIGIELLREDDTVDSVRYYRDFVSGWDYAVECAKTSFFGRVAVTLYADWNTKEYGAVSIPENARMTLNLGGHKIDRATEGDNWNGEVLCISANANVIINDGTITGGYSSTGAGGIHIKDNAKVVLNDVNVDKNRTAGTNGAAIAVYNGATLVMNGGSLSDNAMISDTIVILLPLIPCYPYGTLYVEDATATLNNVTINDNRSGSDDSEGAAIYADNSTVTLNNCVVSGNINAKSSYYAESVIGAENSTLIINNTDFTDNGKVSDTNDPDYCSLFELVDCKLTMKGGEITGNNADKIFCLDDTQADINEVIITGNASIILDVDNDSAKVTLTECTLGNNDPVKEEVDIIVDTKGTLIMTNCELGDTTFEDKSMVAGVGSLFGEGSFVRIIAFVAFFALIASGVSMFLIVDTKKKLLPATAGNTEGTETEE